VILAIDVLIALALVVLSLRVVTGTELFRDIVVFIAFGIVISLAWARLGAPDLALAEAAIGAGLTGALLLVAYRRIASGSAADGTAPETPPPDPAPPGPPARRTPLALPVALLAGGGVAAIGLAALALEERADAAGAAAIAALPGTDLGNPVTAVLLHFRNLDTLLEMAVVLAALLGAWAVTRGERPDRVHRVDRRTPLVGTLLAIVVPLGLLVSVHLLLEGTTAEGGAFQAGATLAACGVLLVLTGTLRPSASAGLLLRVALVAGLVAFVGIGVGALATGRPLMALPGLWAVYVIEAAMMVSIAATLTLLFARSRGLAAERR
jgi:multisubunit Na+/H+ antiporter MnhB subunit